MKEGDTVKVLVIPDIHLKPWMFQRASKLMKETKADCAVCLMDIADDWGKQFQLELYAATYDAAIRFAKDFPDTLWCYGNHDVCYLWNQRETGYSMMAPRTVCDRLAFLKETLPDENQLSYIHRIDDVLFSHGGLAREFVRQYVPEEKAQDTDEVIRIVNGFGCGELWQDLSPIWYRPQGCESLLYQSEKLLQVVGHTPIEYITREGNLVSCDVFSTYRDGKPIGTQEFPLLDTQTWEVTGYR